MTSFLRPLLASLLCGMIVIGHAPAWLHIGGFHHQVATSSQSESEAVCQHSCHLHPAATTTSSGQEQQQELPADHHEHDSDSCVICQSLVAPNGTPGQIVPPVSGGICVVDQFVADASAPDQAFLPIAQPRGPPTCDA